MTATSPVARNGRQRIVPGEAAKLSAARANGHEKRQHKYVRSRAGLELHLRQAILPRVMVSSFLLLLGLRISSACFQFSPLDLFLLFALHP